VAKNMKIFHDINNANILRPTCLTLGVFDGLHRGHQAIMKTVVERAKATETVPTVITFDPHPRSVLSPNNAPPLLQTLDQRLSAFEFLGIKQTIVTRFDQEFAAIDADEFLRHGFVNI
jgi:riboflavin kinase / FMN adenylyltransferase